MEIKKLLFMAILSWFTITSAYAYSYEQNNRYYDNPYLTTDSKYDYMYANPPRQSLGAYGRYIMSRSGVRYVHSPSKLKGVRHAARINAYNIAAYGY